MTSAESTSSQVPLSPRARSVANRIDACVLLIASHWLAALAGLGALLSMLAILAPVLRSRGWTYASEPLYLAYRVICHQRPERSFHVFGEQMAFCQRDLAIITTAVIVSLAFAITRSRFPNIPTVPFWAAALLGLPLVVDGATQLAGLRASVWQLRLATGALFSVGCGWYALPLLDAGFASIRQEIAGRLMDERDCSFHGASTQ